jgi:hypothetical protein
MLERATAGPGRIDLALYADFRAGLLRHVGMEEKILLPAARRARGGEPLSLAARLRRDHGAIAALLVPTPRPDIITRLLAVLEAHDALEEGPDGVYAACDELVANDVDAIVEALRAYPPVRVAPHHDSALVERHIEEALAAASAIGSHFHRSANPETP